MNDTANLLAPAEITRIEEYTRTIGFTMASDVQTGSLLRTLAASKPGGVLLELGTGTGLSAAWLLSGMNKSATLITVDNDSTVLEIAQAHLSQDERVTFHLADGGAFIGDLHGQQFDLVFADTWAGKYTHLDEALALVKPGGLYIVDDMLPQPNWPDGHTAKVEALIATLEACADLHMTKMNWATGIIVCVKRG